VTRDQDRHAVVLFVGVVAFVLAISHPMPLSPQKECKGESQASAANTLLGALAFVVEKHGSVSMTYHHDGDGTRSMGRAWMTWRFC